MKNFMDENFLLQNQTACELFAAVKDEPIIDFHNHLDPREIYEDPCFDNMTEVWLGGDHYKWRAMRANGISEKLITGDGAPFDKFVAWADTVQNLIGNPLYHWTHLELQRYFHIDTPLCPDTAKEIWDACNEKLHTRAYSVRNLLRMQGVSVLCTTDDPADSLEWHKKLREDAFEIQVLPSFRPEKAIGIEKEGFAEYIQKLSAVSMQEICDVKTLLLALEDRLDYFVANGCRVSDHSLENTFYVPATYDEVDEIFQSALAGNTPSEEAAGKFHGYMYVAMAKAYAKHNLVMQLHIGAIRDNAKRFYRMLGPNTGFDALNDFNYAPQLAALLSAMDERDELPKTILYCLNPKDTEMLAAMAGTFCSNEQGIKGKVQLGAAWWFLDHKNGMEKQMEVFSDAGLISTAVGMLTDSRSFLSFPRHELYRRILCNKLGEWVENGEYPKDMLYLQRMAKGICGQNAVKYFQF
ncbi:MAG: glucuronate isomerase [Lachnospiraceae bacterium]|nr:glucuronate isomerase [Lachnospiraceae bacterium]